jgi:DNA-binding MarR family transcriptional regulator
VPVQERSQLSPLPDLAAVETSMLEMREFIERSRRLVSKLKVEPTIGDPTGPWYRAKTLLQQRRRRAELFGADLFSDPAWEILLLLFSEQPSREYVKVRDFSITARLPVTTTLRWLNTLEKRGLIWKRGDEDDRRTTNVGLTKQGVDMMMLYFSS